MTSRRRFLASLAATGAGAGFAGCGYRPGGGDPRWRTSESSGLYGADPVGVADGYLYAVADTTRGFDFDTEEWTTGSRIVGYDTADGRERLDLDLDSPIAEHALGRRGLAVAQPSESDDGADTEVARVTADGIQWQTAVRKPVEAIAAASGRVYSVTTDGRLVACADGDHEWTADLLETADESGDDNRARPSPVVAADADAVVAATGGALAGFTPDGQRRWTRRDLERPRSVVVADSRAFARTDLHLLALDPATGESRWTLRGDVESLALADEGGYRIGDDELVAFDAAGETRWSAGADRYLEPYRGRVAADARGVYARRGRDLVALDPADGSVRWSVETSVSAGPFAADSGVIVVSDGELVCHYASDRF